MHQAFSREVVRARAKLPPPLPRHPHTRTHPQLPLQPSCISREVVRGPWPPLPAPPHTRPTHSCTPHTYAELQPKLLCTGPSHGKREYPSHTPAHPNPSPNPNPTPSALTFSPSCVFFWAGARLLHGNPYAASAATPPLLPYPPSSTPIPPSSHRPNPFSCAQVRAYCTANAMQRQRRLYKVVVMLDMKGMGMAHLSKRLISIVNVNGG